MRDVPTDATVSVELGVPYGPGKLLDIYWPDSSPGPLPTVLLWHRVRPDERDVFATLATAVGGYGLTVVVPDWRSDAPDGGGAHLLASLAFTRERAAALGGIGEDAIVLAGWSRGGRAAAAVAVRPEAVGGWRPLGVHPRRGVYPGRPDDRRLPHRGPGGRRRGAGPVLARARYAGTRSSRSRRRVSSPRCSRRRAGRCGSRSSRPTTPA